MAVKALPQAQVLFFCSSPAEVLDLFARLDQQLSPEHVVAVIDAAAPLPELNDAYPAQIAKVVPNIGVAINEGTLLVDDTALTSTARSRLAELLIWLGSVIDVDPTNMRSATDLASCGPAVLAAVLAPWLRAEQSYGVAPSQAELLATQALLTLAALLRKGANAEQIVEEVAVPSGGTERLVQALRGTGWPEATSTAARANQRAHAHGTGRWLEALARKNARRQ